MTDSKKPGVAFWATVGLVVVLIGYPLSFGPACWWFSCPIPSTTDVRLVPQAYSPFGYVVTHWPNSLGKLTGWYATLGTRDNLLLTLPNDGGTVLFRRGL